MEKISISDLIKKLDTAMHMPSYTRQLTIKDLIVEEDLVLYKKEYIHPISFENCKFKSILINESSFKESLTLLDCELTNFITTDSNIDVRLTINNSDIKGDVTFRNSNIGTGCYIKGGKRITTYNCQGNLTISSNLHQKIEAINIAGYLDGSLRIYADEFINDGSNTPFWNKIHQVIVQGEIHKPVEIYRAEIDELKITGHHAKSQYKFDLIKTNKLIITDYMNSATPGLSLNRIKPLGESSEVRLVSSDLGKAQLRNCEFSNFSKFIYFDTDLSNVTSYSTNWPLMPEFKEERTFLCILPDLSTDNERKKQREIYYRFIKELMNRSGERVESLMFRKMEFNQKLINTNIRDMNLSTISLICSKWFSLHGTNWAIPLLFIIISNTYFSLVIYMISNGSFDIYGLFQLINPAHKLSELGLAENIIRSSKLLYLDYSSRIINSYLAFQFIKAFRIFV